MDSAILQRVAWFTDNPCDVVRMRAVCNFWRSSIAVPEVPRMLPHELWRWAMLRGYEELAKVARNEGARSFSQCIDATIEFDASARMWCTCFTTISNLLFGTKDPFCDGGCSALRDYYFVGWNDEEMQKLRKFRGIVRGDSAIISDVLSEIHKGDDSTTLIKFLGEFASADTILVVLNTIIEKCRLAYQSVDELIDGVVKSARYKLASELIDVRIATFPSGKGDIVYRLRNRLLTAGQPQLHAKLRNYSSEIGARGAIRFAAQSGDRATCEYARKLNGDAFNFVDMLSGACCARDDAMCKLAVEWLHDVARDDGYVASYSAFEDFIANGLMRAREYIGTSAFERIKTSMCVPAAASGNRRAFAYIKAITNGEYRVKDVITAAAEYHTFWMIDIICRESREYLQSAKCDKLVEEMQSICPLAHAIIVHARKLVK